MDCKVLSIAVVVSAILLAACNCVHRGDDQAEMTIDLDVDALLSEEVSIYDMFSDVEVVRLDCVCPISNHVHLGLSNIASDGEKIYLLDWKDGSIHVHAMDGSLVLHADKKGRGPGEYSMADQISYNDELDVVEVLNPMSKILRYTPDSLKFISGVDFFDNDVRAIHNFYQCGDDYILYSLSAEDKLWDLNFETSGTESYGYRPPQYLFRWRSLLFLKWTAGRIITGPTTDLYMVLTNAGIVFSHIWRGILGGTRVCSTKFLMTKPCANTMILYWIIRNDAFLHLSISRHTAAGFLPA